MVEKRRIVYFDLLNICACFCVILLHCNGLVHSFSNTPAWKQSLAAEVLAYWAVPIFFMLSGATLMDYRKKYSTKTFMLKRVQKTVVPFLIWSALILVWKTATNRFTIDPFTVKNIINIFMFNRMENVYWFFVPLFVVYLCMPVLSLLTEEKHRKWLWYMVAVGFLLQSFLPVVMNLLGLGWNGSFTFPLTRNYILFVLLGYLLSTQKLELKERLLIYLLGAFGAVFRYAYTYFSSISGGALDRTLFDYSGFYSVFLAAAVFVLFKQISWKFITDRPALTKLVSKISGCSFGIYLIHMFVTTYILEILQWSTSRFLWRTAGAVMVYLVSLGIILVLKKIPVVKHSVP